MSRPEKPIDWKKVDHLLMAGCLGTEIAPHFDMHVNTFYDRVTQQYNLSFTEYSCLKRSQGDSLLRTKQYEKAVEKDNTMMIWLGKNRLNQREHAQSEEFATAKTSELCTELMKEKDYLENSGIKKSIYVHKECGAPLYETSDPKTYQCGHCAVLLLNSEIDPVKVECCICFDDFEVDERNINVCKDCVETEKQIMNEDLLALIRIKDTAILGIRNKEGSIQVKIPCVYPDSDIAWIPVCQSTSSCEETIRKFVELGGEIT